MLHRPGREDGVQSTLARPLADPGPRTTHPAELLQHTLGNQALCSRLTLQAPDSSMEQEAHRVAAAVSRGTADHAGLEVSRGAPGLARMASEHGSGAMSRGLALDDAWGARLAARRGGGRALAAGARAKLEAGFGVGLGAVRVHSDGGAAGLCRDLRAEAFTHGRDIYFAQGRYAPETARGASLLAHEVTQAVQTTSEAARIWRRDIAAVYVPRSRGLPAIHA